MSMMAPHALIVLYSSDIGSKGYSVSNNHLVEIRIFNQDIDRRARELYQSKYDEAAPRALLMTPNNALH